RSRRLLGRRTTPRSIRERACPLPASPVRVRFRTRTDRSLPSFKAAQVIWAAFFMLKNVLLDRRIWLLGATLILVVVVARWTLDQESAFQAVNLSGYWFTLALVVFALRAIGRVVRQAWKEARWTRFDGVVLAGILLCSAIWTAQERPGFKILADEVLLLGTSMGMHYERVAAYPIRATDVQGPF